MARKTTVKKEEVIEVKPIELLDEKKEYKIEVIKRNGSLKVGEVYYVSGNIANILIGKGLVKTI